MDHHAAPGSLLRSFERHLRARNRSERTIGNYLESARLAESFLEGCGKQLEEAARADLEDFLGCILRRRSANTAATRYKMLRVLYRWLEEKEELPNPMARMKPPIVPEQPVPTVLVAFRTVALSGRLCSPGRDQPDPGLLRTSDPPPTQPPWRPAAQHRSAHHRRGPPPRRPADPCLCPAWNAMTGPPSRSPPRLTDIAASGSSPSTPPCCAWLVPHDDPQLHHLTRLD